jgi:hypothetical protein
MKILLDTYNTEYLNYEAYKEWCEINKREPKGENSEAFYEWIAYGIQNEIDDFFANLEWSKFNLPCIVEGSVGRWSGRFEIEQTYFEDLESAIRACGNNCDYIIVRKNHSVIEVTGIHHDGRNGFWIRLLTDLGQERWERNGKVSLNNRENFMTLPEYLW